jgi:hypothetical protein
MIRLTRIAMVALLVPALAGAAPPKRGPSTAAERKRALEVTLRLERDPVGKGASADRQWLFQWIVDIPDVNVTSCSGPLDALVDAQAEGRHGAELYVQSVFGMAVFLIQHPKAKDDWVSVQRAGIESVLRAYRSLRKVEKDAAWPALDELETARRAGKLADLVRERVTCQDGDQGFVPGTI